MSPDSDAAWGSGFIVGLYMGGIAGLVLGATVAVAVCWLWGAT